MLIGSDVALLLSAASRIDGSIDIDNAGIVHEKIAKKKIIYRFI